MSAILLAQEIKLDTRSMDVLERADLESAAGYPFLSDDQAHAYRLRALFESAVTNMLEAQQRKVKPVHVLRARVR